MPRTLRIQYPGALYHVINRGNYRRDLFELEETRRTFERCLFLACAENGWLLHAYVIMRNHYHAAIETPDGNLVKGMHWLQGTFSTRFNRRKAERGHVFQGRYHALLIKPGIHLSRVVNYIHLNPVRAGLVAIEGLTNFRWSSLHRFVAGRCPAFLISCRWLGDLGISGALPNSWPLYRERLAAEVGRDKEDSEPLDRGWAVGDQGWKAKIAEEYRPRVEAALARRPAHLSELIEASWSRELEIALQRAGKTSADAARDLKAAPWKVAIAASMRNGTSATNQWIASKLHIGSANALSVYLSRLRRDQIKNLGPDP